MCSRDQLPRQRSLRRRQNQEIFRLVAARETVNRQLAGNALNQYSVLAILFRLKSRGSRFSIAEK